MTYQEWCESYKLILAEADTYNKWRKEAIHNLLMNIGPRIAALGGDYSKERSFGKLIVELAVPWQPCANHCGKVEDQIAHNILTEVLYDGLLEDIEKIDLKPGEYDTQTRT